MGPPSWHVLKVFARKFRKIFLKEQLKINAYVIGCCQDVQTHRDKSKFIHDFEVNLIDLWKFLKIYTKDLKVYAKVAVNSTWWIFLSNKRKKIIAKKMKQNCQTRWFCLHSVSMFLSFSLHGTFHKYKFLVKCLNEFETPIKVRAHLWYDHWGR